MKSSASGITVPPTGGTMMKTTMFLEGVSEDTGDVTMNVDDFDATAASGDDLFGDVQMKRTPTDVARVDDPARGMKPLVPKSVEEQKRFRPPPVDETIKSLLGTFRRGHVTTVSGGAARSTFMQRVHDNAALRAGIAKRVADPRLRLKPQPGLGDDLLREFRDEMAAQRAAKLKEEQAGSGTATSADAAPAAGGSSNAGEGEELEAGPFHTSVKQILANEMGTEDSRAVKINKYVYSADPKYIEVKNHLGRYYKLKYKNKYASSDSEDESKMPPPGLFFPNEKFFSRLRNMFNAIPERDPGNNRKFVDRMHAFYRAQRELFCRPRDLVDEPKTPDYLLKPDMVRSGYRAEYKSSPGRGSTSRPDSAASFTALKMEKRPGSSRAQLPGSARPGSARPPSAQERTVYSPAKRQKANPPGRKYTRPNSAKQRPNSALLSSSTTMQRPLSALSTCTPSTTWERPGSGSIAGGSTSASMSRPWSAVSWSQREFSGGMRRRPGSAGVSRRERPASATTRPIAAEHERFMPRPHSAKPRPLSATSSTVGLSATIRPHSATGSGTSLFGGSSPRSSTRPPSTRPPSTRPTSAQMRPQSAQTAEFRKLANLTRPSSANSLHSIGTFRSRYPLPADALEPDEFDEMMNLDTNPKPDGPFEAMERRWLQFRQREMQQKMQADEMKEAVASWREFRTRVEENTVRRQASKAKLEPQGPDVFTFHQASRHTRPQSAPVSRSTTKFAIVPERDPRDLTQLERFAVEGVMSNGYLLNPHEEKKQGEESTGAGAAAPSGKGASDKKGGKADAAKKGGGDGGAVDPLALDLPKGIDGWKTGPGLAPFPVEDSISCGNKDVIVEDVRKTEMRRLRKLLAPYLHEPEEPPIEIDHIHDHSADAHAEDLQTCQLWAGVHKVQSAYADERTAQRAEIQACKEKLQRKNIFISEATLTEALLRPYERLKIRDGLSLAVPTLQFNPCMADPMSKLTGGKKKKKKKK
ncbi:unnamed protein product [Amoebophrya sp. A25]|nr:unnamed protein product [Amoebophrya sp. A25]|eukprot:GSA25T00009834001.1